MTDREPDCVATDLPACSRLMLLQRDLGSIVAEWRIERTRTNGALDALRKEVAMVGKGIAEEIKSLRAEFRGGRRRRRQEPCAARRPRRRKP
jgi:hypothetical protein